MKLIIVIEMVKGILVILINIEVRARIIEVLMVVILVVIRKVLEIFVEIEIEMEFPPVLVLGNRVRLKVMKAQLM